MLRTFRSWLYRLRKECEGVADELALVPVEITGLGDVETFTTAAKCA